MNAGAARLDFDLPDGWWCLDLTDGSDLSDRATTVGAEPDAERSALNTAAWLRDQGARIALLRPGSVARPAAICGGVFITEPTAGVELYQDLEASGEAVALGDLHGIPIISHIRAASMDHGSRSPGLHISYLICAPSICIVITFVARRIGDRKSAVAEVAKVVSAVRVVHSDNGCPGITLDSTGQSCCCRARGVPDAASPRLT